MNTCVMCRISNSNTKLWSLTIGINKFSVWRWLQISCDNSKRVGQKMTRGILQQQQLISLPGKSTWFYCTNTGKVFSLLHYTWRIMWGLFKLSLKVPLIFISANIKWANHTAEIQWIYAFRNGMSSRMDKECDLDDCAQKAWIHPAAY